jgi:SPX domain protein involved in polyphosphate accumulation
MEKNGQNLSPRNEYKYFVPITKYAHLLKDIKLFAVADDNATNKDGFYTVSSIYFENLQLRSYFDKLDGLARRYKLRLRFYSMENKDEINFELKCKIFNKCIKKKTKFKSQLLPMILEENCLEEIKDPILLDFINVKKANGLFPFIRIDYKRKPFFDKNDSNTRITFDYDVNCCRYEEDIDKLPWIPVVPHGNIILEIKTRECFPFWLPYLVKKYSLKKIPISKYLLAVQNVSLNSSLSIK